MSEAKYLELINIYEQTGDLEGQIQAMEGLKAFRAEPVPQEAAPQEVPAQMPQPTPGSSQIEQDLLSAGINPKTAAMEATRMAAERQLGASIADVFTGESKQTELTRRLPEMGFGEGRGFLAGESTKEIAAIAPALLTSTDPSEIAQIVTSNFPNISVTYNKDAKGGVFPVLTNSETGQSVLVNKPGMSGIDVLQGLSLAAAFTPAGRAPSLFGAGLKSGATEATIQGAQAASGGKFDTKDVALSAGLGAGFKGVEKVAKVAGTLLKDAPENELVRASKEAGVPIFTSDILQPKTFFTKTLQETGEKIPFGGTGGLRAGQQEFRELAVDRVADKYGDFSWDAIINSLKDTKNRLKKGAGNVLSKTGGQLDDIGEVPLRSTVEAIDNLKEKLSKPGIMKSKGDELALSEVDRLLATMTETGQIYSSLKQNRTAFREIVDSIDKSERSQLTSWAKTLMQGVEKGMKADLDRFAKGNLSPAQFGKLQKANASWAGEAQKLKKTKLKNILDKGDVTPEVVKPMLFSQNASELRALNSSLSESGRANARAAVISRMFTDLGKRQSGVTPNSFASEMKKYNPQIQAFFKGEEKKQLVGLQKVLEATRRAQDASITTPTGQQVIGGLGFASMILKPIKTLIAMGSVGGTARLYESAPVRNALLRLAEAPKGAAFEKALSEFQSVLVTAAQVARSESGDTESPQQ